jgi:hypothetical protein
MLHRNSFLKYAVQERVEGRIEVKEDEEDDVRIYWMDLKKREYSGN